MNERRFLVPFINLGHLLDHLVMLVFPTVVVALGREWDRPYSELLPLAVGGFIAFGAFAMPAGWLADHWSRYKMMAVFFFGIGLSLFLTGFATADWHIAAGLTLVGMFAATTTLVDELHRTVVGDSPEIQELITELDSMLGSLARHDDLLRNILEVAPLPVRNFTNASGSGNYVDFTGPAGVLVDSWMCALSGRAEEIAANPYFQECR